MMLIQLIISILMMMNLNVQLTNANHIKKADSVGYFRNSLFDSSMIDDLKRKFIFFIFINCFNMLNFVFYFRRRINMFYM